MSIRASLSPGDVERERELQDKAALILQAVAERGRSLLCKYCNQTMQQLDERHGTHVLRAREVRLRSRCRSRGCANVDIRRKNGQRVFAATSCYGETRGWDGARKRGEGGVK